MTALNFNKLNPRQICLGFNTVSIMRKEVLPFCNRLMRYMKLNYEETKYF